MIMFIKKSKDRERQVILCYEKRKWIKKVLVGGKLNKKVILPDEETAIKSYNMEDIGPTF